MYWEVFMIIISFISSTYDVAGTLHPIREVVNCTSDHQPVKWTHDISSTPPRYDEWREQGDPDELIKITGTTTLALERSLFMVHKLDSHCMYTGYAGPAISLGIEDYFISSIFTLAELSRDSCNHQKGKSLRTPWVHCWNTRPLVYSRIDMRVLPTSYFHPDHRNPEFHPSLIGRIDITELALYSFDRNWDIDVSILFSTYFEPGLYNDCYAYSYNYLMKDDYNKMAQVKHRVFVEPHYGYREFMLVTDDYVNSNASVCGFHNRGSPVFCSDKLALITVPDGPDEACSSSRQVRGIPMWFIVKSIKHLSPESEELVRKIMDRQRILDLSQKKQP